jgi:hypothetical protein
LLADPALIRGEISKRLEAARTSDPVTSQRKRLQAALAKAAASITAMIEAFSEQLVTIDELRARMPHLRKHDQDRADVLVPVLDALVGAVRAQPLPQRPVPVLALPLGALAAAGHDPCGEFAVPRAARTEPGCHRPRTGRSDEALSAFGLHGWLGSGRAA